MFMFESTSRGSVRLALQVGDNETVDSKLTPVFFLWSSRAADREFDPYALAAAGWLSITLKVPTTKL